MGTRKTKAHLLRVIAKQQQDIADMASTLDSKRIQLEGAGNEITTLRERIGALEQTAEQMRAQVRRALESKNETERELSRRSEDLAIAAVDRDMYERSSKKAKKECDELQGALLRQIRIASKVAEIAGENQLPW